MRGASRRTIKYGIFRCDDPLQVPACLEALFTLHQKRWVEIGEPGAFAEPRRREFYAQLSERLLCRGWLDFWLLEMDGAIVAAQFCFHYGDTVSLLQEGFEPKFAAEKVGYALRAKMFQSIIEAGFKKYDFLGGDDPHKAKFGAAATSYLHLSFAKPRSWGHSYVKYQQEVTGLKGWIKEHVSPAALALIKRARRLHGSA